MTFSSSGRLTVPIEQPRQYPMRTLLTILFFAPMVALACAPPPGMQPLTVEQLFQRSAHVAYAEVKSVKRSGEAEIAEVKVLEPFKGDSISTVTSAANSCGLSLHSGEKRILFLNKDREGHALIYPWDLSPEAILAKLRELKH